MYVEHSVEILREIRRVLRPDGVCFWNIGDSYAGSWGDSGHRPERSGVPGHQREKHTAFFDRKGHPQDAKPVTVNPGSGLKPKDLCMVPARVALATQIDGWWLRSDIIWSKPNPMPESVQDRPTDAYEHILMLTKSARYYWDAEAVKEPSVYPNDNRKARSKVDQKRMPTAEIAGVRPGSATYPFRNLRNVWTFATEPYKGAHFATFPAELVIRCLQAATKPRDLVLDPFAGSGTVGEVAFNMGRRFVLVDLTYHELARERIGGLALQM
jgi:hypothetical protein